MGTSVLSWLKSSEAGVASSVAMVSQRCGVDGEKVDVEGHQCSKVITTTAFAMSSDEELNFINLVLE